MIEIDEIIELAEVMAILKDFKRINEYEDSFDDIIDKLAGVINKKHQLLQCKYHGQEHTIEKLNEALRLTRKGEQVFVATDTGDFNAKQDTTSTIPLSNKPTLCLSGNEVQNQIHKEMIDDIHDGLIDIDLRLERIEDGLQPRK